MWITLSLAGLTTVVLAARGRPWHGLVAATLGFYLGDAAWSLLADGTGGFMRTVSSPTWWQPSLALGTITVLTGVPSLRRRLFGRRTWADQCLLEPEVVTRSLVSAPGWQTTLLDASLSGRTDAWGSATDLLVSPGSVNRLIHQHGHFSAIDRHVPGPLGQAIASLDAALDSVAATHTSEAPKLSPDAWAALLQLGQPIAEADGDPQGLTLADRADLVLRAASHSIDAALGLAWRWFSGLDELVAALGTDDQKVTLGSPGTRHDATTGGELLAAAWTGRGMERATARVVREDHGSGEVLGLRISCRIEDVVGVGAATRIALLVPTEDPDGLIAGPDEEASERLLGRTCVLLRAEGGLSVLDGARPADRLASQPLRGSLELVDTFVGLEEVLGGEAGIGSADEPADRLVGGLHAVGAAALLAGQAQRQAAIEGSSAILKNVMNGETIEAWRHADLGSLTLRATALPKAAALILDERAMSPSEAIAIHSGALRLAAELEHALGCPGDASVDAPLVPSRWATLPPFPFACGHPASSGWAPGWYRSSLEAVQEASFAAFDRARARSLRELWVSVTLGACQLASDALPGGSSAAKSDPNARFVRLGRAYSVLKTSALRRGTRTSGASPVEVHLAHVEEHLTVCAALAVADRLMGCQPVERDLFEFAARTEFADAATDLAAARGSLTGTLARLAAGIALRASHVACEGPSAELAESVAASMAATPEILRRLTAESYPGDASNGGTAPIRQASRLAAASRVPIACIQRAQSLGQLPHDDFQSVLDLAVARRIVSAADVAKIRGCMAVASEFVSRSTAPSTDAALRPTG
ncbi:acyl-CoA dehydrogenase [Planctomycetes bacterium Poly30]|uniref:Acyl-CoA dehydrogenase n=1 Tax=Saltatorellus ferox TaxID=2528018 RepID=A0A518EY87_9BACT|nr:acyl-CoA dehydrogenase [Planctomycetes bacterium Poly30]